MNWPNCFVRPSCFNVSESTEIFSSVDKSAVLIISTILMEWPLFFFLDCELRGILESLLEDYKINNEKMNPKKSIISNQFISLHHTHSLSMDYH